MFEEVAVRGVTVDAKARQPWVVAVLSVVTLGIYSLFWYYKVNREMRDFGSAHGDGELAGSKPWRSVLAVTIGGLVVIPEIVSLVGTVGRVQAVERLETGASRPGAWLKVLLVGSVLAQVAGFIHGTGPAFSLLGFVVVVVAVALIQARLNTVWQYGADGAEAPGPTDVVAA
jgi:Domain of unknown function (DUF4234)